MQGSEEQYVSTFAALERTVEYLPSVDHSQILLAQVDRSQTSSERPTQVGTCSGMAGVCWTEGGQEEAHVVKPTSNRNM